MDAQHTDKRCKACGKKLSPKEIEAIVAEHLDQGALASQIKWADQLCVNDYIKDQLS